jgi:hypothetical protein
MDIVDRAKKICLTPAAEWQVIAQEGTPPGTLITGYVLPLAGISAVAGFVGGSLVGRTLPFIGTYRVPVGTGLTMALFLLVMAVVGVYLLSLIIDALAPTFGAQKDRNQALKVAVYSYTPAWIAGVFQILPALGTFLGLLGALYGLYLLYLGLPRLMKCPQEKAVGYTAVVVICAIVVSVVVASLGAAVIGTGAIGAGMMGGAMGGGGTPAAGVQFDPDSPMGRLQQLGQGLEENARKMEAAKAAGDPNAEMTAAMEGLGALLGGGRRVEPVSVDQLRPFVPETFAGLARERSSAERAGMAGIMVAKAEATYADAAGKSATLEITDTGGASGLMGLASWMGVQGEKEDDQGSERTHRVGNRLVHERRSKTGGPNEFSIVLGERFMVSAKGNGVAFEDLQAAVSSLDLARLEAMKDEGVQR